MSQIPWSRSRRRLLQGGGALFVGLAHGGVLAVTAAAPDLGVLDTGQARLLQMAMRTLFPHAALGDALYFECVRALDRRLAEDPAQAALFATGLARLPADFAARTQAAREEVLASLSDTPFFGALRAAASRLYRNPAVWPTFAYPGPSLAFGGYVERPLLELDWLAEAAP